MNESTMGRLIALNTSSEVALEVHPLDEQEL